MNVIALDIADIRVLTPRKFYDERGMLSETYNKRILAAMGIDVEFVQDNHSQSSRAGTVRGLHFQIPPFAQDKLVRVVRGKIFDVAVDIRRGSPSFGQYVSVELSAERGNQVFVPKGFAHGFCTLEPDTEVIYKVSNYYSPKYAQGILWNDPELKIEWPVSASEAIMTDRDRALPCLQALGHHFAHRK